MSSEYNYSDYLDFENKDYSEPEKDLVKKFPKALTNKIQLKESADSAITKILDALSANQKHIASIEFEFEYKENEDKESINKRRHQTALKEIRRELGITDYSQKPSYSLFFKDKDCVALYLKYNDGNDGVEKLRSFIDGLSSKNEDGYKSSQKQKMLQSLIMLYYKVILINEKESMNNGRLDNSDIISLNNDACYVLRQTTKDNTDEGEEGENSNQGGSSQSKCEVYHVLKPSVFVTAQNEIICNVVYQKYESAYAKSELAISKGVDFSFIRASDSNSYAPYLKDEALLVKADANSGERGIKFLDLDDLLSCSFFYRNLFTADVMYILSQSEVESEQLVFEPKKRLTSFVTYSEDIQKPPVEFVVVIPDDILDTPRQGYTKFSGDTHPAITYQYTPRQAVQCFLEVIITFFYSDYTTKITFRPDISYNDLDSDVDYIFVQEPKPYHGYWTFSSKDKLEALKEKTNYNINNLGLHFQDDNHPTDVREHDFLKLLDRALVGKDKNPYFISDPYTTIKVDDFILKNENEGRNIVIQGFHLPSSSSSPENMYNLISKIYLIANKVEGINYGFDIENPEKFAPKPKRNSKGEEEKTDSGDAVEQEVSEIKHKPTELYNVMYPVDGVQKNIHTRIKNDLTSKRLLVEGGEISLAYPKNKKAVFKGVDGRYRCYFISKPKIGKGVKFHSSYLDIQVTNGIISILGKGIILDEGRVRFGFDFPISEDAIPYLYNDSFYIVDESGNVLLCYTGAREEQPLSGIYKDQNIMDFIKDKVDGVVVDPKDYNGNIGVNKDADSYDSAFIGFYTLRSKGNKSKFKKGQTTRTWLYVQENERDLLLFATPKNQIAGLKKTVNGERLPFRGSVSSADRIYRIKIISADGDTIDARTSKLTSLYLQTATFNINNNNDYSFRSVLHTLTKIALRN